MTPTDALPERVQVQVSFLSDWHVGTGDGRVAAVDAQVRRDGEGLPFVPAKTLTGVLRDACETVAHVLDQASDDTLWARWIDWLFGSQPDRAGDPTFGAGAPPRPAAVQISPLRLSEGVRARLAGRRELVSATVLLRPAVALDNDSEAGPGLGPGTAQEKKLRVEERARGGLTLSGTLALADGHGPLPREAELLLRAGARLVDALGGRRNRGAGRCVVLLVGADGADPDTRLSSLLDDDALLTRPQTPPGLATAPDALPRLGAAASGRQGWRIVLNVRTPLLAHHRVIGNVNLSLPFVPGTTLLPAILPLLGRPGGLGYQDVRVHDARVATLSEDGTVLAGRAVPATWQRPKDAHDPRILNAARSRPDPAARSKSIRTGDVVGSGDRVRLLDVPMTSVTHAVVDDANRRPTAVGGGVYSMVGIAPGTLLAVDVEAPVDARLDLAVGQQLRLGRSRKDDFGAVTVHQVLDLPLPDTTDLAPDEELSVWCLSQVLLRDERLAWDPRPERFALALSAALAAHGADAHFEVVEPQDGLTPTASRAARRDGFHARWGLPRPSLPGLAAGSVITLRLTSGTAVPGAALREVLLAGIGERTAEGFGRIAFNDPLLAVAEVKLASDLPPPGERSEPDAPLGPDEVRTLEVIQHAAWRAAISRSAAAVALTPEKVIDGIAGVTSRAQRAALLDQVERLALPQGPEMVADWFASTERIVSRKHKWGAALASAQTLMLDDAQVWRVLNLEGPQPGITATGTADEMRERLRPFALRLLLEATLRQVRNKEEVHA